MSVINREDVINYLMTNMNWHDEDGYPVEDAEEKRAIITDLINGVPDADDGWISVENKLPEEERWVYFMETEKDVEIAWYAGGWFKTNNGLAWTNSEDCLYWKYIPLPKPYEPKEDK